MHEPSVCAGVELISVSVGILYDFFLKLNTLNKTQQNSGSCLMFGMLQVYQHRFTYNVDSYTPLQEPGYKARYDVNVKQLRFVNKAG